MTRKDILAMKATNCDSRWSRAKKEELCDLALKGLEAHPTEENAINEALREGMRLGRLGYVAIEDIVQEYERCPERRADLEKARQWVKELKALPSPPLPPAVKCEACEGTGRTDNHVTGEVECSACDGSGVATI